MSNSVIVTEYTVDALEWDSEEDFKLMKERYGKQPIYFVYERSWTVNKIYSNLPDLYSESRGCSIIRREAKSGNVMHV